MRRFVEIMSANTYIRNCSSSADYPWCAAVPYAGTDTVSGYTWFDCARSRTSLVAYVNPVNTITTGSTTNPITTTPIYPIAATPTPPGPTPTTPAPAPDQPSAPVGAIVGGVVGGIGKVVFFLWNPSCHCVFWRTLLTSFDIYQPCLDLSDLASGSY
jgi:hypothetical protein